MRYVAQVISGTKKATELGFPTLNLIIPRVLPFDDGIYAGKIWVGNNEHVGLFHLGPVPTFNERRPVLEVHVVGETIKDTPRKVEFDLREKIRDIKSFPNAETMTTQIREDVLKAKEVMTRILAEEAALPPHTLAPVVIL